MGIVKEFIHPDEYRDNTLKLIDRIYRTDHFVPDVIYASLRGGAYMANIISEYYKLVRPNDRRPVFYAAVVARSYAHLARIGGDVVVDGWTYSPEHLRTGDKILLVDDVFDTGKTVNKLVGIIMEKGIPRDDIKVCVYDYKLPLYKHKEFLPVQPDYYCRKHVYSKKEDETWIHYMYHEFEGLAEDEIDQHFKDPEVRSIMKRLLFEEK